MRPKKTAVGADGVRPTEYQIRNGHIVVPLGFYQEHREELDWKARFDMVAFGTELRGKRIDDDRRLTIRLRDQISAGELLRLRIKDGRLHVTKER